MGGAARTIAALHAGRLIPCGTSAAAATSVRPVAGSVKSAKAADPSPCSLWPFQAVTASVSDHSFVRVTRKPYRREMNFWGGAPGCFLVAGWVAVGGVCVAWVAG